MKNLEFNYNKSTVNNVKVCKSCGPIYIKKNTSVETTNQVFYKKKYSLNSLYKPKISPLQMFFT